jgi:hypothetical protein
VTSVNKCPVCEKTFPTQIAMRQHFNDTHRSGTTAQAFDADTGPDALKEKGAVAAQRCGNCKFWGKANNIMVCRRDPGTPGMAQGAGGIPVPICFLPPKFAHDWCGQWQAGEWPAEPRVATTE